ncbi:MAG: glycosyltransferase family 4 protein [Flavobacteriales bacterium]|nr:glycosyltransferase family 4 protein [Flavobacteriales bacterium]
MTLNSKKRILVFVDWFLPGKNAGGPIRSVANIIERFSEDFDFQVVTSVFDFGSLKPYPNVEKDQWTTYNGIRVWYASKPLDVNLVSSFIQSNIDVVYMNSLFSKEYTQLPLKVIRKTGFSGKVILAPRGMLGAGALAIKPTKKKVFLKVARTLKWYSRVIWHASTDLEEREIRTHFGVGVKVVVAENLASLPDFNAQIKIEKVVGEAEFVFVSRISIKKNLLFWIQQLPSIVAKKVIFHVIGPVEDEAYWKECVGQFEKLDSCFELKYHGSQTHDEVLRALNKAHFFVLPTLHENYGHVVIEALSMGCPVLLSDNTPWGNLKDGNIGSDIPLSNTNLWRTETQRLVDMTNETYIESVEACVEFANSKLTDKTIINKNKALFGN